MKIRPWELPVHPSSEGRVEGVIQVPKQSDNVTLRVLRKPPDRNASEPRGNLVMRIVGADSLFIGERLKQLACLKLLQVRKTGGCRWLTGVSRMV